MGIKSTHHLLPADDETEGHDRDQPLRFEWIIHWAENWIFRIMVYCLLLLLCSSSPRLFLDMWWGEIMTNCKSNSPSPSRWMRQEHPTTSIIHWIMRRTTQGKDADESLTPSDFLNLVPVLPLEAKSNRNVFEYFPAISLVTGPSIYHNPPQCWCRTQSTRRRCPVCRFVKLSVSCCILRRKETKPQERKKMLNSIV